MDLNSAFRLDFELAQDTIRLLRRKGSLGSMLTKVVELEVVAPYGLKVRFNTGAAGTHDCSRLVREPGPLLQPLSDPTLFGRAFLEFGAPTWPNGFDMAPEWLRREMVAAGELAASAA